MGRHEELKSCPFCGVRPHIDFKFGQLSIDCRNDKCAIKPSTWLYHGSKGFDNLLKIWNKRADNEQ